MLKNKSIKYKICLCAILLILVTTFIISLATTLVSTTYLERNVYNNIHSHHEIIGSEVKNIVNYTNYLHSELVLDADFRSLVTSDDTKENKTENFKNISNRISVNRMIYDITICYLDSNKTFSLNNIFSTNTEETDNLLNKTLNSRNIAKIDSIKKHNGNNYLMIAKAINIPYNSSVKAICIYYLDESYLSDCFNEALSYEETNTFILKDGYIISNDVKNSVGTTIYNLDKEFTSSISTHFRTSYNNKKVLVVVTPLSLFNNQYKENWNLVSIIPEDMVFKNVTNLVILITAISLLFIGITIPLLYSISKRITNPLIQLSLFISTNTSNEIYETVEDTKNYDELKELIDSYNKMVSSINYLIEKNKEDEELKRKLELEAMQMQINPHFLYNVLDTISWIAKIKKQDEIQKITMSLASFFRLSLHKGDKYITVDEEISLIKSYSEIEYIRRNGNFNVIYNIDPAVKNIKILKLILQPLIENAFKHGISSKENGIIEVSSYLENEYLILSIKDNGDGFKINKNNEDSLSGFGLKNIEERLKLEYKENASLMIESNKNDGTKCVIKIHQNELIV